MLEVIKDRVTLECYRGLTLIYQLVGKNEKAQDVMTNIIQKERAKEKDWWLLGRLYVKSKKWEHAYNAFLHAVQESGGKAKYIYWLGQVEEYAGYEKTAESYYDEVINRGEGFYGAMAAKARILLNRNAYREALAYYECCFQKKTDPEVYNGAGLCYMGLEEYFHAVRYLKKALSAKPDNEVFRFNYASALLKIGNYRQALTELQQLKRQETPLVYAAMGYCYGELGRFDEGIRQYEKALGLSPDDVEYLLNQAVLYVKNGNSEEALQILKALLQKNPADPDLYNNIAWIYEEAQAYKEAEDNYYRGLTLSSGNLQIAYNLICCLNKQGKYLEAMEVVHYLENDPGSAQLACSCLARIYENLGADKAAVDCYNKALGLD